MGKVIGFGLLLSVVVIWVASSTLIQEIFIEVDFFKPFFLTYFSTALFSLYLPTLIWKRKTLGQNNKPGLRETAKLSLQFCPLWFCANYLYNVSLGLTTVSSSTILSSTSGVITLILSVFLLRESPDVIKFLAVLSTLGGVACIALADNTQGEESLIGDSFAFCGAIVYSLYCIFIKAKASEVDMMVFLGIVGALNTVLLLPGFVILHYTGIEPFEWPNGVTVGMLLANGLVGTVLSDLLWALSVRHLNPALCTLGLSLTIPLSILVETLFLGADFYLIYGAGALLVIIGFVIMSLFVNKRLAYLLSNQSLCKKLKGDKELKTLI